jgi:hypothetical protein
VLTNCARPALRERIHDPEVGNRINDVSGDWLALCEFAGGTIIPPADEQRTTSPDGDDGFMIALIQ